MGTILVVDRNPCLRETISGLLKQNGLNVLEAADGKEAIEQIESYCPDVVITDIVMPWINGYELCQWLKNNPKINKKVSVAICSGRNNEFDRYWGKKKGADAYLGKPFHPAELIAIVNQLLPLEKLEGDRLLAV